MGTNQESVFKVLSEIQISNDKIKQKNRLNYLPWASAWSAVKKIYPDTHFKIYPQVMDEYGNTRPWHDDGKSGWVEVGVTINGVEVIETLAIMNVKMGSVPADQIDSVSANKAIKRCMVKALAHFGLGLYLYEGEDLPDSVIKIEKLQAECLELIKKKCKLSDKAKNAAQKACIAAYRRAEPQSELTDDIISGNPALINNEDILENLKTDLMAIRK